MKSSIGFDNIIPFIGVVEEREEGGAHQGRVRVRAFGIHPPYYTSGGDENKVETEDLPWAMVVQGGYGKMWSYPDVAEWVFGFFLDGRDAQHPIILGTIPGTNLQLSGGPHAYSEVGETGINRYVKDSTLAYEKFGQQALPPQLTGEFWEETPMIIQNIARKAGEAAGFIRKFIAGEKPSVKARGYDEPEQQGGGTLDSSVWQTRYGGSYIEMNGTRGSESVVITHDRGSTVQLDSSGNIKLKSFGSLYEIAEDGHIYIHSDGALNLHAKHGDLNINCENGTTNLVVGGDMNHIVTGDYNLMVGGRIAMSAGGGLEAKGARISLMANAEHISLYSDHDIKIGAARKLSMHSEGNMHINTESDMHVLSAGNMHVSAEGYTNITSDAVVAIDGGPDVMINGGVSIKATPRPLGLPGNKDIDGLEPYKPQVEEPPEMGVPTTDLENGYSSIGVIGPGDLDDFDDGGYSGGSSGGGGGSSGSSGASSGSDESFPGSYNPNPNAGAGGTDKASQAYDYFIDQGWTPAQAAGIVGNLQAESGSNLAIDSVGDGGRAYGIAQWHPDRQANFEKFAGKPIDQSTFEEQLGFVQWEFENTESAAAAKIKNTNTAADAAWAVDKYYERSSGAHRDKRMDNAVALERDLG